MEELLLRFHHRLDHHLTSNSTVISVLKISLLRSRRICHPPKKHSKMLCFFSWRNGLQATMKTATRSWCTLEGIIEFENARVWLFHEQWHLKLGLDIGFITKYLL